ncbi:MAG: nuclear transport factor 2 family protein [Deltaproteobacteria bacterium]|nr:nuclear transport factor 2 family protein [Deltaproteobacteria bacterium]
MGCEDAALEKRIVALEAEADRQAVIRLIDQYAHAIDGLDDALLERTFAPDAVATYKGLNYPMDVRLEGFPAIRDWLRAQLSDGSRPIPWHYMGTHLVDVVGDRATLRTYQHNRTLAGVGLYTVEARRTPAGWRIARLHLDQGILDPKMLEEVNTPEHQERIRR